MAPHTATVKYSKPGTIPPIYLAGSFSSWEPQEMQYTTDANNEHEFFKEVEVEQGKEYQYKFRLGHVGDWWILNEDSPTGILFLCFRPIWRITLTRYLPCSD